MLRDSEVQGAGWNRLHVLGPGHQHVAVAGGQPYVYVNAYICVATRPAKQAKPTE